MNGAPAVGDTCSPGTRRVQVQLGNGSVAAVLIDDEEGVAARHIALEDHPSLFGLQMRLHPSDDGSGVTVEALKSGLFGALTTCGSAAIPRDAGDVRWLHGPERSDAGLLLSGIVEAIAQGAPEGALLRPRHAPPRARAHRTGAWDALEVRGRPGGLPADHSPSDVQRALGGTWDIRADDAPDLMLEARIWFAHQEADAGDVVTLLAASWHGPGAEQPWHTELHITHRREVGRTEFVVIDGSTADEWVLAHAVHLVGQGLRWIMHPAPHPDRTGPVEEALLAFVSALANEMDA